MIDVSDGLLADLGHILESSKTGAVIEEALLPLSGPFRKAADGDPDLIELALSGGEDYELLFAVSPEHVGEVSELARTFGLPVTHLGKVAGEEGLTLLDRNGRCRSSSPVSGYDHFGKGP